MRETIHTENAALPGGTYSQAVIINHVVYISGQGSFLPGTATFAPGTFREQAERTFQNIGAILAAGGSSFEHVAKVSVFLTDLANFPDLNEICPRYFKIPFPARTTVQVVLSGGMLIEVDCVAEVPTP